MIPSRLMNPYQNNNSVQWLLFYANEIVWNILICTNPSSCVVNRGQYRCIFKFNILGFLSRQKKKYSQVAFVKIVGHLMVGLYPYNDFLHIESLPLGMTSKFQEASFLVARWWYFFAPPKQKKLMQLLTPFL